MGVEDEKRAAAAAAAELVEDGMTVGLGTGTTVAAFLPVLATRRLRLRCVATSPATAEAARALGITVDPFSGIDHLDLAVDGADQVGPDGWLMKGGGGAHTREKVVAAAASRFVVIVSSDKPVRSLHAPVPLELLAFGLEATIAQLGDVRVRPDGPSPDGGVLANWYGAVDDPAGLDAALSAAPGLVSHGLFSPALVSDVLLAGPDGVEHHAGARRRAGPA